MAAHAPGDGSPANPAAEAYRRRFDDFTARATALATSSTRVSHLRTGTFVLLVGAGLFIERQPGALSVGAAVLVFAAFAALVRHHRSLRARERWFGELAALNREGLHRLDRDWDALPPRPAASDVAHHAYAADLDLFGRAAVAQLLGPGGSVLGAATLDDWLLHAAAPDVVRARQQAAAELAPLVDLRDAVAVHGRRSRAVRRRDLDRFTAWAAQPPWFRRRTALRIAGFALPAATWVLLALHLTGVTGALWLATALASLIVSLRMQPRLHRTFDDAFGREGMFEHFPDLFGAIADATYHSPLLQSLRARLAPDRHGARERLARLRHIMHYADLRVSSIHFVVQIATMWDFHVMAALEKWQEENGSRATDWLNAAAEFEALCALAALTHDEPHWSFPDFADDAPPRIQATALGHALIPDGGRVHNDVALGPPGTFLLITGSNMSGKSTLLRSIGVNVVLAQAGAPVCARSLVLTPLRIRTSIRVQDSLARGVSYFMAELERLKEVVDAAEHVHSHGGPCVLFLLDEILHGTNTAERRIAATRVIRHLADLGAIGAVTTHDLEIAGEPDIAPRARLVHFEETFGEHALSFDYRLREGLATSTNALKLMAYVGLPRQ
jgi:hypothetical protein